MDRPVPFVDLQALMRVHGQAVEDAVAEVIRSGRFIGGPRVEELERRLAREVGVARAVACGSGTAAEKLIFLALEIGPGDEVIIPDFTFMATAEAVAMVGATPVCVDVDPVTFTLDPTAVRKAMGPKVKAIVPVSLFGHPADFSQLEAIADEYGVYLIEDACQSLGSHLGERTSGSFGLAGFTSFYPSKPLGGIGDGGMVFTDDEELAEKIARLRHHGEIGHHLHRELGLNSRLDAVQAAALLAKLDAFPREVEMRGEAGVRYREALRGVVRTPIVRPGCHSSYAQYTVRTADSASRDDLVKHLAGLGIPTAIHYPQPLHTQQSLRGIVDRQPPTPITEELCRTVLSLPLSAYISADDQERVIAGVQSWADSAGIAAAGG